jgi:hypothetical protein
LYEDTFQKPIKATMNRLNEPAQKNRTVLRELMIFVNGIEYAKDHEFPIATLALVKPLDIYRWMCLKVFQDPNPGPEDNLTHGRSSSLMYYKKLISYFMPNRLMAWNELTMAGNPTRSVAVNDLIKAVKKKEVRKQGKAFKADRALEKSEFEQMVTTTWAEQQWQHKLLHSLRLSVPAQETFTSCG